MCPRRSRLFIGRVHWPFARLDEPPSEPKDDIA